MGTFLLVDIAGQFIVWIKVVLRDDEEVLVSLARITGRTGGSARIVPCIGSVSGTLGAMFGLWEYGSEVALSLSMTIGLGEGENGACCFPCFLL